MNSQFYGALAWIFGFATFSGLAAAGSPHVENGAAKIAFAGAAGLLWSLWMLSSPSKRRPTESFYVNRKLAPLKLERASSSVWMEIALRGIVGVVLCVPVFLIPREPAIWALFAFGSYQLSFGLRMRKTHILQAPHLSLTEDGITYYCGDEAPRYFAWGEVASMSFHRWKSNGRYGTRIASVITRTNDPLAPEFLSVRHRGVKPAMRVYLRTFGNPRAVAREIETYLELRAIEDRKIRKSA